MIASISLLFRGLIIIPSPWKTVNVYSMGSKMFSQGKCFCFQVSTEFSLAIHVHTRVGQCNYLFFSNPKDYFYLESACCLRNFEIENVIIILITFLKVFERLNLNLNHLSE